MDLGENGNHNFANSDELRSWVASERTKWGFLNTAIDGLPVQDNAHAKFESSWLEIERLAAAGEPDIGELRDMLVDAYCRERGVLVHSTSPTGHFLLDLASAGRRDVAAATVNLLLGWDPREHWRQRQDSPTLPIAWTAAAVVRSGVISLTGRASELREAAQAELDRMFELRDEAKTEFEKTKRFFEVELPFEAPVKFWRLRARVHWALAGFWGLVFALASGVLVWLLLSYQVEIWRAIVNAGRESVLAPIAAVTVFALPVVWALRLVARLFLTSVATQSDARERQTMIETFIALRRGDHVDEKALQVIVKAIFRPSTETSPPQIEPPGAASVLKKLGL